MRAPYLTPGRLVRRALLAAALLLPSALDARAQGASEFVVVVHESNPVATVSRDQLSRVFLKKVGSWGNGREAVAVDLADEGVRDAFSRRVHRKSAAAIRAYWQQQIFSGREVPPPEKTTGADVVAFVRTNPAAVGYVPPGTPLGSGVKPVEVVD